VPDSVDGIEGECGGDVQRVLNVVVLVVDVIEES